MQGRRARSSGVSHRSRWLAGGLGLALAAGAAGIALTAAGPAGAAARPNYHAGSDQATFTVTGVEDSNCVISTGGRSIFIKPGDRIDFDTAIASASLGGVNLLGGKLAGLNVKATVDGQKFSVGAGQRVRFSGLAKGTHTLRWTASSVAVRIPGTTGLLGQVIKAHTVTIPLSNSQLKTGAKLDWSGHIYVTSSAPKCTISVSTPRVHASVGPVKVVVPPVNGSVPTGLPRLPKVPKLGSSSSTAGQGAGGTRARSKRPSVNYTPPALSVPDQVVPQGQGDTVFGSNGGGYQVPVTSDDGSQVDITAQNGQPNPGGSVSTSSNAPRATKATGRGRPIEFASSEADAPSGQLPVLLAILAVLALAFVAGTYARLYLLGRNK